MAKKNGFVKEFKEFISRGSVIDLAVGVIIGGYIIPFNLIPVGYPQHREESKDKFKTENIHYNKW